MRFFRLRRPKPISTVPEFPLRCQHCEKPIKLTRVRGIRRPTFSDPDGTFMCESSVYIPHRPMPSILG